MRPCEKNQERGAAAHCQRLTEVLEFAWRPLPDLIVRFDPLVVLYRTKNWISGGQTSGQFSNALRGRDVNRFHDDFGVLERTCPLNRTRKKLACQLLPLCL